MCVASGFQQGEDPIFALCWWEVRKGQDPSKPRVEPWEHSHPDFVPPDDEGYLAAPGVDEAGPAGVQCDVLPIAGAESDGRIVERLSAGLQD